MDSLLYLGINKMEIDWGKNNAINDFYELFQEHDFEQDIPYYYLNNSNEVIIQYNKGAKKQLKDIKQRLDLLGYDLKNVENKFYDNIKEHNYYTKEDLGFDFKSFMDFIKSIEIEKVDNISNEIENVDNGYEFGDYFRQCICEENEISIKIRKIIKNPSYSVYGFFENLDPYIILRLLAENERNLEFYVEWRYNDSINNEWIEKKNELRSLDNKNKITIVTEGTTDSFIIRKTIKELYPHISDFFLFIDMKENYPFTGVGNLKNFCNGLSKINIQNNIIVLFDNDVAGREIYNSLTKIDKPRNLLYCILPEYSEFNDFDTLGPYGNKKENINGKAVSIECFLDFSTICQKAIVRWKNYNEKMKEYQGALEKKESYTRYFKKANLLNGSYDCTKLKYLIDYIINKWINRSPQHYTNNHQ